MWRREFGGSRLCSQKICEQVTSFLKHLRLISIYIDLFVLVGVCRSLRSCSWMWGRKRVVRVWTGGCCFWAYVFLQCVFLEDEGNLLQEVGFERRWNAFERNRDRWNCSCASNSEDLGCFEKELSRPGCLLFVCSSVCVSIIIIISSSSRRRDGGIRLVSAATEAGMVGSFVEWEVFRGMYEAQCIEKEREECFLCRLQWRSMPALCECASQSLSVADQTLCVPRCNSPTRHPEATGLLRSANVHHQQCKSGVPEPETTTTSFQGTGKRLRYLRPKLARILQLLLRGLQGRWCGGKTRKRSFQLATTCGWEGDEQQQQHHSTPLLILSVSQV